MELSERGFSSGSTMPVASLSMPACPRLPAEPRPSRCHSALRCIRWEADSQWEAPDALCRLPRPKAHWMRAATHVTFQLQRLHSNQTLLDLQLSTSTTLDPDTPTPSFWPFPSKTHLPWQPILPDIHQDTRTTNNHLGLGPTFETASTPENKDHAANICCQWRAGILFVCSGLRREAARLWMLVTTLWNGWHAIPHATLPA